MPLPDLHYLEESEADTVIAAVHQWCAKNGCEISSDDGKRALRVGVRLAKSAGGGGPDLLMVLTEEMAASEKPFSVPSVLVLEAEPFIALDMEVTLEEAGFAVKACFSRTEALQWLTSKTPSAAILDYQLKDGVCTDVALLLQTRGVPIIFCSGAQTRMGHSSIQVTFDTYGHMFPALDEGAEMAAAEMALFAI